MTLEFLIIGVLALWCVVIIVYQLFTIRLMQWTRRWDVFRVLPSYRLFAAVPRDLRLLIRVRLLTGAMTPWQELALNSPRCWWHVVWHPQRLVPHVRSSMVENLVDLVERHSIGPRPALEPAFVYRGLVHALRHLPHAADTAAWQFKIEEGGGDVPTRSIQIVFTSPFHPL